MEKRALEKVTPFKRAPPQTSGNYIFEFPDDHYLSLFESQDVPCRR
jgi:hypothetical protein